MKRTLLAACAVAFPLCSASLLAGCTATTAANWRHEVIAESAAAERQLVIDNGHCRQVAIGAAPMPPLPVAATPQQPPAAYDITAQTTTTGPGGMTHATTRGTVTPAPAGGFGGGFASGLASGAAQGAALRQQLDARRAQSEIHKGCMYRLGWTEARR